jgi:hypothetical protein
MNVSERTDGTIIGDYDHEVTSNRRQFPCK